MSSELVTGLDHVQVACPAGSEDDLRLFYVGVLGMRELPKPPALAARGGAWFGAGPVRLHLGVEAEFRPARKAHPALLVDDLPALVRVLETAGHTVREDVALDGYARVHVDDPFGNRLELMQPSPCCGVKPL